MRANHKSATEEATDDGWTGDPIHRQRQRRRPRRRRAAICGLVGTLVSRRLRLRVDRRRRRRARGGSERASFPVVARAFGDGFWSLIPFTLQQVMVVVSGYIIASSPPAARLIDWIAGRPKRRAQRHRLHRRRHDVALADQLGVEPRIRRPSRARRRAPRGPRGGLSRSRRRRLSRPRRHMGAGGQLVGRAIAGQRRRHSKAAAGDYGRHPIRADDFSLAIGRHAGCAFRRLDPHRLCSRRRRDRGR